MKLRVLPCRATQDRWVTVESSDKKWSNGEANGKPLEYSCRETPMNSMNRQKDVKLKKIGKTTRPFRYDLNQIPYDYTVEVRNRFKGLDR